MTTPGSRADIAAFVRRSVAERPTDPASLHAPSKYWGYFVERFAYLYDLSDAELARIRYHTYHLTGDHYQRYLFRNVNPTAIASRYRRLVAGLGGFQPHEPAGGFGYEVEGGLVTEDLLRYLEVLNDLRAAGVLGRTEPLRVLEIGGGYGGLARLLSAYNPGLGYVICDLEETIFLQANHLANVYGLDAIRLVEAGEDVAALVEPGHFVLLPQHRSEQLRGLHFDLAINQESMQEMTLPQVRHYLALISALAGRFYSYNLDQHREYLIDETKIVTGLHAELDRHFPQKLWEARYEEKLSSRIKRPMRHLAHVLLGRHARHFTRSSPTGLTPNRQYRCVYQC